MAFTFFFRDLPVLEYAVEKTLGTALGRIRIKVWDAGCALGQEPYTLSILFAERLGSAFNNLYLDATDYDSANNFGDMVKLATYKYEELQRIPPDIFKKYFEPLTNNQHQVCSKVRSRVFFQYHERIKVIKMYHQSLSAGGYLALENTQKMPSEIAHLFEQVVPNAQLYRKV